MATPRSSRQAVALGAKARPSDHHDIRCAIYTRKSTDERLHQDFNSLESQRDICSAYVLSQRHKGWIELPDAYDDPAQSGGSLIRPALQRLLNDVEEGLVDMIVIYKIDRLTRSLRDFVRLMDLLEQHEVGFVSITQSFDTSDSMGRMIMNVLLTFAQFERELAADRVRDKVAAMKQRGKWTGGAPPFGYDVIDRKLVLNPAEAPVVRQLFEQFLELGSCTGLKAACERAGLRAKVRTNKAGQLIGGGPVSHGMLYGMLACRYYVGEVPHLDRSYPGEHQAIVPRSLWNEVQALRAKRAVRRPICEPSPNILLGLLYDAWGRRMTIADDSAKGTRYRYYISDQSRSALRSGAKRLRAEANALEELVIATLMAFLADAPAVRSALTQAGRYGDDLDGVIANGASAGQRLRRMNVSQRRSALMASIKRVDLSREAVRLFIRPAEIERLLRWSGRGTFRADKAPRPDTFFHVVEAPAMVRMERGLALPIFPVEESPPSRVNKGLSSLIKEARMAQAALYDDRAKSIADVARQMHRQPGFLQRLIRINYLAPDIVTSILDGRQPSRLTRKSLINANLPMDWAQQRKLLGFPDQPAPQQGEQRY